MAEFTPGPYKLGYDRATTPYLLIRADRVDGQPWLAAVLDTDGRQIANGHLLAAAPDLYEALRGIMEIGKRDLSNPKYDGYFATTRAALAKARGEVAR